MIKKEYRMTIWSFLKGCGMNILLLLFVLYMLYQIHYTGDAFNVVDNTDRMTVIITLFLLAIGISPFFVYFGYFFHDKDTILTIDFISNTFIYKNGDCCKTEKIENIKLVVVYHGRLKNFRMGYSEIYLGDDTRVIVTCLFPSSWLKYLDAADIVDESKYNILI